MWRGEAGMGPVTADPAPRHSCEKLERQCGAAVSSHSSGPRVFVQRLWGWPPRRLPAYAALLHRTACVAGGHVVR